MRALIRITRGGSIDDLLAILASNHWGDYPRTPFRLASVLGELNIPFEAKGFFVLLPLSLPVLGDMGNICKYSLLCSYGLRDVWALRYLGAKLIYICRKPA
jgi:hypothetical protein